MVILGIDPGSAVTGYGIIKKTQKNVYEVVDFGCISAEEFIDTGERLKKIYKEVSKIIQKHNPTVMAVESLYFFKNLKTVMPVSQTRGVILLAGSESRVPILEFTPMQVKMTVAGYGRAEKKQVIEMVKKILDVGGFDMKKNYRKKDDAFDALGIALCAACKNY